MKGYCLGAALTCAVSSFMWGIIVKPEGLAVIVGFGLAAIAFAILSK